MVSKSDPEVNEADRLAVLIGTETRLILPIAFKGHRADQGKRISCCSCTCASLDPGFRNFFAMVVW